MPDVKAETNGHLDLAGVRLNPAKLKVRELVEIERQLDRRVGGEMMTGEIGADLMQALLWVALRRMNPAATYEDAGEFDFTQVVDLLGDDEPEVDAEVDPPSPSSASSSDDGSPAAASSKASRSSAASTG